MSLNSCAGTLSIPFLRRWAPSFEEVEDESYYAGEQI